MKIPLLINPIANSEHAESLHAWLAQHEDEFDVVFTESREHMVAQLQACVARGDAMVAVAGGDGTLQLAIAELAGSATCLAVIPSGTQNVFARDVGIGSGDFACAYNVLKNGVQGPLDVFEVDGQPFLQMAGVGYDARAVELTTWKSKKRWSTFAYIMSGVRAFFEPNYKVRVTLPDGLEYAGCTVLLGNGRFYGLSVAMFSEARHQDGLLDVVVFKHGYLRMMLGVVASVLRGGLSVRRGERWGYEYFQVPSLQVRTATDVPFEVDGDLGGHCPRVVKRHESRVQVMLPRPQAEDDPDWSDSHDVTTPSRGKPRVLILTSGYGDGHNSAANGLASILKGRAKVKIADPNALGMPGSYKWSRAFYYWVIAKAPRLWKIMFKMSDRLDGVVMMKRWFSHVEQSTVGLLQDFKPDVVVVTYMTYPYLMDRLVKKYGGKYGNYVTMITDSLVVSNLWRRSGCQCVCVTDEDTKAELLRGGMDTERIHVTRFPVDSSLDDVVQMFPIDWQEGAVFRVLFFAQRSAKHAVNDLESLLQSHPCVHVTCVLARKVREIYPAVIHLKKKYLGRLRLLGWTNRVPELLRTHHLVVMKAGGASTHEAIAAARPVLVNHLLYGQEQGNTNLLESLGGGSHVSTAGKLKSKVQELLGQDGAEWRKMHRALQSAQMTHGATRLAEIVLKRAENV